jgi:hypothetical protein
VARAPVAALDAAALERRVEWDLYVVVHAAANSDYADACARYRELLVDRSTFASATLEELLDAGVLPGPMVAAFRDRYIPT